VSIPAGAQTPPGALALETKISLGQVRGRIDHLAIDLKRQRLFIAELGNGSLGIIDLAAKKLQRRITGLHEPQGIAYDPDQDALYVANGGDGSVRIFREEDLSAAGRIELGNDADNVRVDGARNRVIVGYGNGALAIIDPATQVKVGDIRLKAHPESFQIDGDRAFVNVPQAGLIEVVDLVKGEVSGAWPTHLNRANFAMAVGHDWHRLFAVFRSPARLVIMSSKDGSIVGSIDTCGDADDVFIDTKRQRVYVTCGAGVIDVLERRGDTYGRIGQITTVSGARTSLFVPEMDRLFLAVRASGNEPAAIWVFQPAS